MFCIINWNFLTNKDLIWFINSSHLVFNSCKIIFFNVFFKEKIVIKNTTFINLPLWFKDGLIDYLSIDWNTRLDSQLKDLILSKKIKHFQSLSTDESVLYGHGLWRYVDEIFGRNMIPNLMYMMKVSKSVESGFIYVLGITSEMIQKDFTDHK